ncbi:MAG: MBL fold metallo-hydrolase [Terriglobia bacterium]
MKIKWLGHATFLIEGDNLRIVTDPYTPSILGLPEVQDAADIVIRSSADDEGHCNAAMIRGEPVVITATEIPAEGVQVKGIQILAIPAQESLIYKEDPGDNAMYRFTLEGLRISHLGDVGNKLSEDQIKALSGTDVLLAPAGGPPTIDLDDLCEAIEVIQPRVVIPMHYMLPGLKVKMLPITAFTSHFPASQVDWSSGSELELSRANLPGDLRIRILNPEILASH